MEMEVKAKFTQLTAKQGKSVMQFELDEACEWALPDLITLTGKQVMVALEDPQQQIDYGDEPETLPIGGLLPERAKQVPSQAEDAEFEEYEI